MNELHMRRKAPQNKGGDDTKQGSITSSTNTATPKATTASQPSTASCLLPSSSVFLSSMALVSVTVAGYYYFSPPSSLDLPPTGVETRIDDSGKLIGETTKKDEKK